MHLQRIAPLLLALAAASVNPALARVLPGARNTIRNSSSAFISRHRSPPLQSTSDTCLYANSTTLSDLSFQGLPSGIDFASDSCLCISELSSILRRDSSAELVETLEYTEVEQTLEAYVSVPLIVSFGRNWTEYMRSRLPVRPTPRSAHILPTLNPRARATTSVDTYANLPS